MTAVFGLAAGIAADFLLVVLGVLPVGSEGVGIGYRAPLPAFGQFVGVAVVLFLVSLGARIFPLIIGTVLFAVNLLGGYLGAGWAGIPVLERVELFRWEGEEARLVQGRCVIGSP